MERFTEKLSDGRMVLKNHHSNVFNPKYGHFVEGEAIDRLSDYEDLEEQGKLLKNPQELKDSILDRMKEFMDEYRSYSESSIDHFGGKADSMETAMRIVKAAFAEALEP